MRVVRGFISIVVGLIGGVLASLMFGLMFFVGTRFLGTASIFGGMAGLVEWGLIIVGFVVGFQQSRQWFLTTLWHSRRAMETSPRQGRSGDALVVFRSGGLYGWADSRGKVAIEPRFTSCLSEFSEGLVPAQVNYAQWGYVDTTGAWAVPPMFDKAARFGEGLAAVEVEGKVGFIEKTGGFAIEPFLAINDLHGVLPAFSQGLAPAAVGSMWGFIDTKGDWAIAPKFDHAGDFSDWLAPVKVGEAWGFVGKRGRMVIHPRFMEVTGFGEGLAAALIGNKWGYIDRAGSFVIQPRFDSAHLFGDFAQGRAEVMIGDRWATIDKTGKVVAWE